MSAAKKPRPGQFVKGHDPRRGARDKKPPPPKKPSVQAQHAINAGATPEEVEAVASKGYFQKGHDPRRLSAEEWATRSPKPSVVRAAARLGWVERLPWLLEVIDGTPQPVVRQVREKDKDGKPTGRTIKHELTETPSVKDRLQAFHELGEMAGIKTMSITDGEGGDIPSPMPMYVLSNLSTEELQQLEQLALRAKPKALQAGLDPAKEVR